MQQRKPDPFNLYILGNDQTISAVWKTLPPYTIILYPVSQNGEKAYNARLKLADEKNNATDSIDVSMGKQEFANNTGFISKKATSNYAALVTTALENISTRLVEANIEVPQAIKDRLAKADMQSELIKYDRPRYEQACELKQKEEEDAATQALTFHMIANDPEPAKKEMPSSTVEHKNPQAHRDTTPNNPDAEEVVPMIPKDIGGIIHELADDDFFNAHTTPACAELTLFGRPFLTSQTTLGNMILRAEAKDVEIILAKVREKSEILNGEVTAIDPCGTPVRGTLLQIAAMTGHDGLVDMLVAAGGLSPERVTDELQCVTSDKAKAENEARIQRYLNIIIEFGESIGRGADKDEAIKVFKEKLQAERNKEVHAGLVFDLRILQEAAEWFAINTEKLFDKYAYSDKGNTFLINCLETLHSMLSASACDAYVRQQVMLMM